MALVLTSGATGLSREAFTVVSRRDAGGHTLVIPSIAVELVTKEDCYELVDFILDEIEIAEEWARE